MPSAPVGFAAAAPGAPAPSPAVALEATIRLAGESNFTRARVTLRPAELGGVEVLLRGGGSGLTATVIAESPHAAHLLQGAAGELQRRLAAQGLQLTSLQVSVGGEAAGAAHGGGGGEGGDAPAGRPGAGASPVAAAGPEQTKTIDLGGGVLIDVLA